MRERSECHERREGGEEGEGSTAKSFYSKIGFSGPYSIAFQKCAKGGAQEICRQTAERSKARKCHQALTKCTFRLESGKTKCDRNEGFSAPFFWLIFCNSFCHEFRTDFDPLVTATYPFSIGSSPVASLPLPVPVPYLPPPPAALTCALTSSDTCPHQEHFSTLFDHKFGTLCAACYEEYYIISYNI